MPAPLPIHPGDVFDRWTVVQRAPSAYGQRMWLCRCTCGTLRPVCAQGLVHSKSRSCGCIRVEEFLKRGPLNLIHGESKKTTEWIIWNDMVRRCYNRNDAAYANYGGRGIQVCDRWRDYRNFLADMGRRPSNKHSIERKDNDSHYEPSNCMWATILQQANNRRNNLRLTFNGRTQTIPQWAREIGINRACLAARLKAGWPAEKILHTPVMSAAESSRLASIAQYGH